MSISKISKENSESNVKLSENMKVEEPEYKNLSPEQQIIKK